MSDSNEQGARQRGIIITKPIVYGNISRYFGKKREEDGHTHKWTVFLRPYNGEDISAYVKRVQFKLHDSYPNPTRIVTKPPFEISETGWGEFDMQIKIYFADPQEKPVIINHLLKLFQNDTEIMMGRKDLVREIYDELVFVEPSLMMQRALNISRPISLNPQQETSRKSMAELQRTTLNAINELNQKTSQEIVTLKEQLKQRKNAIDQAREILDFLEQDTLRA